MALRGWSGEERHGVDERYHKISSPTARTKLCSLKAFDEDVERREAARLSGAFGCGGGPPARSQREMFQNCLRIPTGRRSLFRDRSRKVSSQSIHNVRSFWN